MAQSSANRKSLRTVSLTFVAACSLLGLNKFPSVLYLMPMPSLQCLKALDSMGKHHAEQRWGQEATLLDSVGHWRGFGGLTVVQDAGHNAIMELVDNYDELNWQPNFSMIFQSPSRLTVSKALVRSTKVV